MRHLVDLLLGSRNNLWMGMPNRDGEVVGKEVEVFLTIGAIAVLARSPLQNDWVLER